MWNANEKPFEKELLDAPQYFAIVKYRDGRMLHVKYDNKRDAVAFCHDVLLISRTDEIEYAMPYKAMNGKRILDHLLNI